MRAAEAVPAEDWNTMPSEGRWSAAELVAHLMMVERAVIDKADRVSQKSPKTRFFVKENSPTDGAGRKARDSAQIAGPGGPGVAGDKEDMLAELRKVRERSLAFLEETRGRDLREYCWKHPALGNAEHLRMDAIHRGA